MVGVQSLLAEEAEVVGGDVTLAGVIGHHVLLRETAILCGFAYTIAKSDE